MRSRHSRAVRAVLVAALVTATGAKAETACQRLAPKLRMTDAEVPAADGQPAGREWRVNVLGGLGTALFGGSAIVTFAAAPGDDAVSSERRRVAEACKGTAKGVVCDVVGPAQLTITTKTGPVIADFARGDHALVGMRKGVIYCRDE